ncbi:arf-GAP domain and FG repeat-containing protein 2 isoform X2 [Stigmatopora nigra]
MSNRKHRDNQEMCSRKVRELAQSGVNKHCFECNQPGVTYTDVTVGAFVCTSCSGMLRGLNPPHRVKSISMTTFSQQEVEFLQNHGNEVGRRTWLCALEPKVDGRHACDAKDSQKFKEFLQDKYEKKKWHFSKCKNRRDAEGPWSPGVQTVLVHGPLSVQPSHILPSNARAVRTPSQLVAWERPPASSPADPRSEAFTARPSRSQSFRDPALKEQQKVCGMERQRPGSQPSGHVPPFPALPRPSASTSFKKNFTLGRTASTTSGAAGPFRAFAKSLSLDFGGLKQPQASLPQSLSQQQTASHGQDRYAAVSQLDCTFSDTAPPAAPPQYNTLFSTRLSGTNPASSSASVETLSSPPQTFASFPNPFSSGPAASRQPTALSPGNPFGSPPGGETPRRQMSEAFSVFSGPGHANADDDNDDGGNGGSTFSGEAAMNQEANGFAAFPSSDSQPKVPRPMSVNPFTGNVYPSRGTSRNPFI